MIPAVVGNLFSLPLFFCIAQMIFRSVRLYSDYEHPSAGDFHVFRVFRKETAIADEERKAASRMVPVIRVRKFFS